MHYGHAPHFLIKQKQNESPSSGHLKEMNTIVIYRQKIWVYVGQNELVVELHVLIRVSNHLWARIRKAAYGPEKTTQKLANRVTAQKCESTNS